MFFWGDDVHIFGVGGVCLRVSISRVWPVGRSQTSKIVSGMCMEKHDGVQQHHGGAQWNLVHGGNRIREYREPQKKCV